MTHQELIQSPEYWVTRIQYEFFNKVSEYLEKHKMSRSNLASQLGVSKSYITQILNGNANMSLEKLIEISLAIGYYPQFLLATIEEEKEVQNETIIEELMDSVKEQSSSKCMNSILRVPFEDFKDYSTYSDYISKINTNDTNVA